jgi:acyl carrier protein
MNEQQTDAPAAIALSENLFIAIAQTFGIDRSGLSVATTVDEIGLDSLTMAQLIATVEVDFQIELNDGEMYELVTARSLGDYLSILAGAVKRAQETPPTAK